MMSFFLPILFVEAIGYYGPCLREGMWAFPWQSDERCPWRGGLLMGGMKGGFSGHAGLPAPLRVRAALGYAVLSLFPKGLVWRGLS